MHQIPAPNDYWADLLIVFWSQYIIIVPKYDILIMPLIYVVIITNKMVSKWNVYIKLFLISSFECDNVQMWHSTYNYIIIVI